MSFNLRYEEEPCNSVTRRVEVNQTERWNNLVMDADHSISGGPHITGLAKSMHVRSGSESNLPCTVSGDEPLSIIWSKDGVFLPVHDER